MPIQSSTWWERTILPPSIVCTSIDISLKDLPAAAVPKKSPTGVPVASPRTVTWLPDTSTSLIFHCDAANEPRVPPDGARFHADDAYRLDSLEVPFRAAAARADLVLRP